MKKLFSTTLALLLGASLTAQITFGPRAGFNLTNISMKFSNISVDNNFKAGLQVGAVVDIPILEDFYAIRSTDLFSIQTGLLLTQKGGRIPNFLGPGMNSTVNINYLEIPLNQQLFVEIVGDTRLILQTGLHLGFALGGTIKTESSGRTQTQDIEFGSNDNEWKPLNLGINLGVGVEFLNFQVMAGYSVGFTNLSNISGMTMRNSGFAFTVTYLFDLF